MRNRVIRKRMQIGNHVGALAVPRNTGKSHRGARNKAPGIGDELVEVLVRPGAALGLHGCREIKSTSLAFMVADNAVKIWTDAVGTALLEGVAGGAFSRPGRTLFDGSGLQEFLDRLGRRGGIFAAPGSFFLHCDYVTRFFRHYGANSAPAVK